MSDSAQKSEVVFFVFYTSLFHCGPWQNSIKLWMEKGYNVSIFQIADPNNRKHKPVFGDSFVLNEIKGYYFINFFRGGLDRVFRLFKYLGFKKLSNFGSEFGYLATAFYFVLACYLKTDKKRKYILIGGDPPGLLCAALISRIKGNILVYWSLELWVENDLKDFFAQMIFKKIEKWANRKALCTVDFGDKRCELLRIENDLAADSMISIPNSPLGAASMERNYYFNEKFGICRTKKIILYAGGLADFYGIDELLEFVDLWPKETVLVLHSRIGAGRSEENLLKIISDKRHEIYLDKEPVEYNQLRVIYSSCDIGLQVWKPVSTNLAYPDLASGKIFHWLQSGVPVIVRNLLGYKEFVEGNGIGICVDEMRHAGRAIETILNDEKKYKENSIKVFNKFRFEDYHKELIGRIEQEING